jgi:hypothetical protein
VDVKRERLAEQYRALGVDSEHIVEAQCWMDGCGTRVEVPFIEAAIGRTYCPAHSVMVRR